jgi:hypothetical protein
MMESTPFIAPTPFDNILYIGDEGKICLTIIEKFNNRLHEIEEAYAEWFDGRKGQFMERDKLQHHIYYHFEGGIAVFKFRNEDEIPANIRMDCLRACKSIASAQLVSAS